jgi:hypothetical protein
MVVVAPPPEL